jgi:very-short-patch-repair endonuclease
MEIPPTRLLNCLESPHPACSFTSPPCGEVGAKRRVGRNKQVRGFLTPSVGARPRHGHAGFVRSEQTERARELRNNMTNAEWKIWSHLRNRQMAGYKFRRQFPIGPYFADFACLSARLVIEVDGGEHHGGESDQRKTAYLETSGYRVLRIPVQDIDETMDDVMHGIFLALAKD